MHDTQSTHTALGLAPRLYQHRWMDEDVEMFRAQVRDYAETELAPHLEGV